MASRVPAIFDSSDPCSPLSISNQHTALLLMDYQNLTAAMIGEPAAKVVSTARTVQKWAVENGIMVVHCLIDTRSGETPEPFMKSAARFKGLQAKLHEAPALGRGMPRVGSDLGRRKDRPEKTRVYLSAPRSKSSSNARCCGYQILDTGWDFNIRLSSQHLPLLRQMRSTSLQSSKMLVSILCRVFTICSCNTSSRAQRMLPNVPN